MAARKTYAVSGFCPELDWRPTVFVGPIPPCKVCAWCGVIPVTGLLLPCGELVCLPCREKNGTCAIHGTTFAEHELEMTTFSPRHMMQRKVYCWSEGCNEVGTVFAMLQHYEKDCTYRTGPPGNQKANAECGRRHGNVKQVSEIGHKTRTQSAPTVSGNSGGTVMKNGKPLRDSDARVAYLFEGNSDIGSIKIPEESSDVGSINTPEDSSDAASIRTSRSVERSTSDGEPREGMHGLIHGEVNTSAIGEPAPSAFADNDAGSRQPRKAVEEVAHAHTQNAFENEHANDDAKSIQPSNTEQGAHIETSERLATDAYQGDHVGENVAFRACPRVPSSAGCTSMEHGKPEKKSSLVGQDMHIEANETTREPLTSTVRLWYSKTDRSVGDAAKEPPPGKGPRESAYREDSLEARHTSEKMNSGDHSGSTGTEYYSDPPQQLRVEAQPRIKAEGAARDGNSVWRQDSGIVRRSSGISARALCCGSTNTNDKGIDNALSDTSRSLKCEESSIDSLKDTEEDETTETVRNARQHNRHIETIHPGEIADKGCGREKEAPQRKSSLDVAGEQSQGSDVQQTLRHNLVKQGAQGLFVAAEGCSRPTGHDPTCCFSSEIALSGPIDKEEHMRSEYEVNKSAKRSAETFIHCHVDNEAESGVADRLCTLSSRDSSAWQTPNIAFADNEEIHDSLLRQSGCEPRISNMSFQSPKEKTSLQQGSNAWFLDDKEKILSNPEAPEPCEVPSSEQYTDQEERNESKHSLTSSTSLTTGLTVLEMAAMKDTSFQGQDDMHCKTGEHHGSEGENTSRFSGGHYLRGTFGSPSRQEVDVRCMVAGEAYQKLAADGTYSEEDHSHNAETAPVADNVFTGVNFDGIRRMIDSALHSVSTPFYLSYNNDSPARFSSSDEEQNASRKPNCTDATTHECDSANTPRLVQMTQQHQIRESVSVGDQKARQTGSGEVASLRRPTTGENHTTAPLDDTSLGDETESKEPGLASTSSLNNSWSLQGAVGQPFDESFPCTLSRTVKARYTREQNMQEVPHELVHSPRLFRRSGRFTSRAAEPTEKEQVLCEAAHETYGTAASPIMSCSDNAITSDLPTKDAKKSAGLGQSRMSCERDRAKNTDNSSYNTKASVQEKADDGEALLLRDTPGTGTDPIDILLSLKRDLETAVAAIKQCIEKHPENNASLREHEEEIRDHINEVVNVCKAILQSSLKASESCEWYVEDYDQVKKKVLQHECWPEGRSSPLYLQGYKIKPSVLFRKKNGALELGAELTLYKGLYDDFIRWPFQESCKLTLLHPSDESKNVAFSMSGDNEPGYVAYLKPRGMKNVPVHANEYRSLQEIEEGGFVCNNKLHFRFEVSRE